MFLRIPQVLSVQDLAAVTAGLESDTAPWVDGRVTAGHQGVLVKSNQQLDEASATARELGTLVVGLLERNPIFISAVLPHRVYPPLFNRYREGMQFGSHIDGAIRQIPGTAQTLRTDLSATLFLSAPESYDGGELVIDGDSEDRAVKLTAGDLFVYTSTARHRVNPVMRGQRLACVFWIQSLIRDDFRRGQLFELDQTIQLLTTSRADASSLLRLTGLYHSLLRLWSEL